MNASRDLSNAVLSDLAPDHIRAIAPYQGGKPICELSREMGLQVGDIVKLASNENPLGISPKAEFAIQEALLDIARYPDGNSFALREAVSNKFKVAHNQIVFGNGSNDILELAARAFLTAGCEAIYSQHAFAVYPLVTQATGATGVVVPAKNYGHDLPAMLAAITDKTRMIFVANPNNPTGTLLGKDELFEFLKQVPKHVLVVLDEAYDEYLSAANKSEAIGWLNEFDNLIISRTFSKAYGLAGLRVGFGLCHADIADLMNRVRQPFNVNSIAQAAAVASLADDDFVERSYALNQAGMVQLTQGFNKLRLEYIPSFANFVSFAVKSDTQNAAEVNQKLLQKGVIVRPIANYEMPDYLRVSIGLFSENARFLEVLEEIINK
ncbi:histidinol-phosphate transaminase [Methylotenera sp.]|uniref:histidinol-phosphate transaminase n=1 Tax=Methylotenera sp. TaxID=2051956 RepID=UPI002722AFBF|nr:histidinol-phosphate transaminase [Methylotenera sp.]MDO9206026.1 histidinol-phosphate transaminase [Methylotenera sp.]MDP1522685.1 histidinol-phosphate transaminase [Methylotenera sp.]MDP2071880.1 histidinol-phosphate transaminase [Methylotenera sp.]MDP2230781.1 histidinol-phosphate transaminase [Methylotenera sp.]MDP3005505.1 histidinol-phosphate transaminase [Methylotenera sp.]